MSSFLKVQSRLFTYLCLILSYCGKNTSHEIYSLKTFLNAKYRTVDCGYKQASRAYSSYLIKTLCLLTSDSPFPLLQLPATTLSLWDDKNLTVLDSSCKWNQALFVFLCLAQFTFSITSSRFIHVVSFCKIPFFCWSWIVPHCVYTSHFLYPFICLR